jgi:hypothetical protein
LGTVHAHPPVKLVTALLGRDLALLAEIENRIEKAYGPVEERSEVFLFTHAHRFDLEMGENLSKRVISFAELLPVEKFPEVKLFANDLEWEYREHLIDRSRRLVNIDPGYVTLSKVVLASTRNYAHHIYLGQGVYAELLLRYHRGALRNLPWTYPDFRTHLVHSFFSRTRDRYQVQLRARFAHPPDSRPAP